MAAQRGIPFWVDPSGVNQPDASPGVSWDGVIGAGDEIIAIYLALAVGSSGSSAGSTHPLKGLTMPFSLNDGFGAVFNAGRVFLNASPSAGGNYILIFGGFQLSPPFALTPQDTHLDLITALPGVLSNLSGGPGSYQWVTSGAVIDGSAFVKGTAALVRKVA